MGAITLIIQDPPYQPGDKAWHALRFAGAALADSSAVRVFLLGDGVLFTAGANYSPHNVRRYRMPFAAWRT